MPALATKLYRWHVDTACCPEPPPHQPLHPLSGMCDISLSFGRHKCFDDHSGALDRPRRREPPISNIAPHGRRRRPIVHGCNACTGNIGAPPVGIHRTGRDCTERRRGRTHSGWNQQSSLWTFTQRMTSMDTQMSLGQNNLGAHPARYRRSDDGAFSTGRPLTGL